MSAKRNSMNSPKSDSEESRRHSVPAKLNLEKRAYVKNKTSLDDPPTWSTAITEEGEAPSSPSNSSTTEPTNNPYGNIPPPVYSSKPTVQVGFTEQVVYGQPPYPEQSGFPEADPPCHKAESPMPPSTPLFKPHEAAIVDINDPALCDHMTSRLTKQVHKIKKITGSIVLMGMTVALAFIFMDGAKMDLMFCNFLENNFIVGCKTVVGYSGFYILSAALIATLLLIAIFTAIVVWKGSEYNHFDLSVGHWSHKIAAFIVLFIGFTLLPVNWTSKVMVHFGYVGAFIISVIQLSLLIDLARTLYRAVKRQRPYKNRGECSKAEFILIILILACVSCVLGVIFTYDQCEFLAYFYYVTAFLSAVVFIISMISAMTKRQSLPYFTFLATVSFAMWMCAVAFSHWPNTTCNLAFFPISNHSLVIASGGTIPKIQPQQFWNGNRLLALSFARSETDKVSAASPSSYSPSTPLPWKASPAVSRSKASKRSPRTQLTMSTSTKLLCSSTSILRSPPVLAPLSSHLMDGSCLPTILPDSALTTLPSERLWLSAGSA
ncbi:hypothetical protein L596_013499 [Steinernema carpocapsae]|uniref:Uncharacterized protein n=1 Tax=Steinernema carpocapsae TaxID=34508 RepID=A0A4U5P107_STECR|nr:hypothetical protein L596_013499 [Steinernema carpocapsae]